MRDAAFQRTSIQPRRVRASRVKVWAGREPVPVRKQRAVWRHVRRGVRRLVPKQRGRKRLVRKQHVQRVVQLVSGLKPVRRQPVPQEAALVHKHTQLLQLDRAGAEARGHGPCRTGSSCCSTRGLGGHGGGEHHK